MGAHNQADVATCGAPQPIQVRRVGWAGVNGDVAGARVAHQIAVGAGPGHHARVGRGQAQQVLQERHWLLALPVQVVLDLAVRADQRQFAVGVLVLHVAGFAPGQQPGARAAGPKRLLGGGAGLQHCVHVGVALQPLQRSDGREDDEKLAGRVASQSVGGSHPDRFELLLAVGHWGLPGWHARHQKRHVKTSRQVAVGHPVRQHKHRIGSQQQAACPALGCKGLAAVKRGDVLLVGRATVGVLRQQYAKLFKALPDGGNRLRQVQVALDGPPGGQRVAGGIERVHAAARKHIGARRKAGRQRAARHQHFQPGLAIAQ